jgi:ketosteroid isomerase-like protein
MAQSIAQVPETSSFEQLAKSRHYTHIPESMRACEQRDDAAALFAAGFRYRDHGIGLEFSDKQRLSEFFQKTRELYPDYSLQTDEVFVSGDRVITQWTVHVTVTEPFYAGLTRRLPISIAGISIIRTENGKITDWADYYDGLTARRTALAVHFTEWVEY